MLQQPATRHWATPLIASGTPATYETISLTVSDMTLGRDPAPTTTLVSSAVPLPRGRVARTDPLTNITLWVGPNSGALTQRAVFAKGLGRWRGLNGDPDSFMSVLLQWNRTSATDLVAELRFDTARTAGTLAETVVDLPNGTGDPTLIGYPKVMLVPSAAYLRYTDVFDMVAPAAEVEALSDNGGHFSHALYIRHRQVFSEYNYFEGVDLPPDVHWGTFTSGTGALQSRRIDRVPLAVAGIDDPANDYQALRTARAMFLQYDTGRMSFQDTCMFDGAEATHLQRALAISYHQAQGYLRDAMEISNSGPNPPLDMLEAVLYHYLWTGFQLTYDLVEFAGEKAMEYYAVVPDSVFCPVRRAGWYFPTFGNDVEGEARIGARMLTRVVLADKAGSATQPFDEGAAVAFYGMFQSGPSETVSLDHNGTGHIGYSAFVTSEHTHAVSTYGMTEIPPGFGWWSLLDLVSAYRVESDPEPGTQDCKYAVNTFMLPMAVKVGREFERYYGFTPAQRTAFEDRLARCCDTAWALWGRNSEDQNYGVLNWFSNSYAPHPAAASWADRFAWNYHPDIVGMYPSMFSHRARISGDPTHQTIADTVFQVIPGPGGTVGNSVGPISTGGKQRGEYETFSTEYHVDRLAWSN